MVDYGLVSRNINELANRIGMMRQAESRDALAEAQLRQQGVQYGLANQAQTQDLQLKKAVMDRQAWLDQPVTMKQAIAESNWTPEQKDEALKAFPADLVDTFVARRGEWAGAWQKAMSERQKQTAAAVVKPQINDFATFYRGFAAEHPGLEGGKLDAAASEAYFDRQVAMARETGGARGAGYAKARTVQVLDTQDQNRPVTISAWDLIQSSKTEPGRYITGTQGQKALQQTALIEDIRGTIGNVKQSLGEMPEFTAGQRAQIAIVMKQRDPNSALSNFFGGTVGQTLDPIQQTYLIDLAQLVENAMAMRAVLGAGQGSEDLRMAIKSTIPGPSTPNKAYALKQLEKFEQVLNRLERGIPNVPLRKPEAGKPISAAQSEQSVESPPIEGARKAPDGNWYVEENGKFKRVVME